MFGFQMVLTMGKLNGIVAILFLDLKKTEYQNVQYFNALGIRTLTVQLG